MWLHASTGSTWEAEVRDQMLQAGAELQLLVGPAKQHKALIPIFSTENKTLYCKMLLSHLNIVAGTLIMKGHRKIIHMLISVGMKIHTLWDQR